MATCNKVYLQLLHKKWSFVLRISSVNVTKSAVTCGFDHIYWRNPLYKTSFFVQCTFQNFKNIKVKFRSDYHNESNSLKAHYSAPGQRFSLNSEKFVKLQGDFPWWSIFLIKLYICNTFARIRLCHFKFLVTS